VSDPTGFLPLHAEPEIRVDCDPVRLGDREWYARALQVAISIASRDGLVWPDDLTATMRDLGHRQPLGQAVSSFWAWAAKRGLRQTAQRRMSRDPERNGAKVFAWEVA
jgi:hypothetical protein